ncbi:ABC-F family ATP-binding cassette domain-containing protein [Weissella cibaria]|uniref:ABC-F family ATP-binding cassette domain-containing protein n=1 Tax=Weissella cibaria TaxID=137591 RepID=UPI001CD3AFF0|nr:ABC-F family ATP-binding cassette domain-containing protein [Weissella cibaria]MCA1354971.1 ABC-F family ATP-binding cassette domain-containing protein [Weissella cibaria]MDQ2124699.1 ABC-F family ATP-binding cassette domain-containing protein [Weissella cibaria]MDQ2157863.1 ABC-F family ATP-binding cassette domain-containing protein [Weissella cibaria]
MIILQASNVARRFSGVTFFENISMQIQDKGRVGLVGRNGAGKSTLLKMLIGETQPDEGTVSMKKGIKLAYLAQNSGLDSDLSVYNEMLTAFDRVISLEKKMREMEAKIASATDYESDDYTSLLSAYDQAQHDFNEMNGYGYEATIRSVLHGFGFDESFYDQKISSLSGGQRTRLAIAKQLLETPDLLILDEPTNHLDMQTLSWLERYLQNYQGALLIVSHDRYFLDRVVNEIYDMHSGVLDHYTGNYSRFMELKAAKVLQEQKAFDKQQEEIAKLEDFVNRNIVRASTTKRAQSRRKQLERMERLEAPKNETGVAHIQFSTDEESGNEVMRVNEVKLGYDLTNILAEHVNIDVDKQHAVALVGPNGIGKSTLIKTILGKLPLIAGTIKMGANVEVGYYDQEQQTLDPKKSVLNTIWDEHPTMPERDVRSILGSFMFSGESVDKIVSALSGGERARLLLTKLSLQHANFLILDEPTNHLDIDSREVLETALNEFNGTIFFVSHDRYFINAVATEVVELSPNGTRFFDGDYDYYLEKTAGEQAASHRAKASFETTEEFKEASATPIENLSREERKERQKEQRKLERAVSAAEEEMETLNTKRDALNAELNDPANGADLGKLTDLSKEIAALDAQLATVEEQWTEASMALEEFND